MNIKDVLNEPQPSWTNSVNGESIIFPDGNQDSSLAIKSIEDDFLLELEPKDGDENEVTNYPPIPHHEDVKVEINAGNSSLTLSQSQISFTTDENEEKTVYLPSISLETGETENFWISTNGSTYEAEPTDEQPDFSDLAQGTLNPWKVLQPGYKVELVATGFQLPVNIAFVSTATDNPQDPLFYVAELYGNIKVVTNDGSVSNYATDILNFNPTGNFPGSGEIGLAGLAIDPIR